MHALSSLKWMAFYLDDKHLLKRGWFDCIAVVCLQTTIESVNNRVN